MHNIGIRVKSNFSSKLFVCSVGVQVWWYGDGCFTVRGAVLGSNPYAKKNGGKTRRLWKKITPPIPADYT
jgi:hypothetical protein